MVKISIEESSTNQHSVHVETLSTGHSDTLKDMNIGPDIRLTSEEEKQLGLLRQENERLKSKRKIRNNTSGPFKRR